MSKGMCDAWLGASSSRPQRGSSAHRICIPGTRAPTGAAPLSSPEGSDSDALHSQHPALALQPHVGARRCPEAAPRTAVSRSCTPTERSAHGVTRPLRRNVVSLVVVVGVLRRLMLPRRTAPALGREPSTAPRVSIAALDRWGWR